MRTLVRHLVGVGLGIVAVPVLILLSAWSQREQQLFAIQFVRGHAALFVLSFLVLGAVVGVLCAARVVSPVASLISGGVLFLLSCVFWLPFAFGGRTPISLSGFLGRAIGYTPTLLVVSAVLLVASVWPSRWRSVKPPAPYPPQQFPPQDQPRPFPGPEVRP